MNLCSNSNNSINNENNKLNYNHNNNNNNIEMKIDCFGLINTSQIGFTSTLWRINDAIKS